RTLSGGEMQRLRLAAQLGAGLTGALYVLDEPTIGLHPRDTRRLLDNLRRLVDTGSSVLVVEHDAECIRRADRLIDMGPEGGRLGGRVLAVGTPAEVLASDLSPTGRALSQGHPLHARRERRSLEGAPALVIRGARAHNLRIDALSIPLQRMVVVAGVSGSGKSTLVTDVIYPAVRQALGRVTRAPGPHDGITLPEGAVERAALVDQSPIGRTSRSVPATFLKVLDVIRRLFASLPEARAEGFSATRFSFNSGSGGRCEACKGNGVIAHEMAFLPDVKTVCQVCDGLRFEPATLAVRYRGLSIGAVLKLTVREALDVFAAHPTVVSPLATLLDLGVGYLQLGQGSPTLSGGEAQRLKLAKELTAGRGHRPTLYVLDEPTTGLHVSDVGRLVEVLDRLVARGDSLLIIEHHPDVIAAADHVVELGPEGGEQGGRVVAEGDPRSLARRETATGRVLGEIFTP
ncbi:MAG: excinuclease ABC subunit A, partial [Myxococcales bacterium]|nr:excinuclease ABC subunit A [Myxococcales bacterium]